MEMYEVAAVLITAALGYLVGRKRYLKFKKVLEESVDVVESTVKLLNSVKAALKDDEITKDEAKEIVEKGERVIDEFNEFVIAVKQLVSLPERRK